jgi:hypothetical protein
LIYPDRLTNFNRSRAQLEELALFATLVAGKPARRMARLLNHLLPNAAINLGFDLTPFEIVRIWVEQGRLGQVLREYGTGQYARLEQCWTELTAVKRRSGQGVGNDQFFALVHGVDLGSIKALEQVHGIGPKTARLIVLHSVPGIRAIPVDTHWMKELRSRGYPVSDGDHPMGDAQYRQYETWALMEADRAGMSPAAYDLLVWRKWNEQGKQQQRRLAA